MPRPQMSPDLMRDLEALMEPGDAGVEAVVRRLLESDEQAIRRLERLDRERRRDQLREQFQQEWLDRFEDVPPGDLQFLASGDWIGGATGPPESWNSEGGRARDLINEHGLQPGHNVDESELRRLGIPRDEFTIGFGDVADGAAAALERRRREAQGTGRRPVGVLGSFRSIAESALDATLGPPKR